MCMKYALILLIALIAIPVLLHAATLRSLGGRVVSTPQQMSATITCTAAYGPFMMQVFNTAVPGPYFIRATTRGVPSLSSYLLGNYRIIPDIGTCYNSQTGAPVPAFEIKLYGTSR